MNRKLSRSLYLSLCGMALFFACSNDDDGQDDVAEECSLSSDADSVTITCGDETEVISRNGTVAMGGSSAGAPCSISSDDENVTITCGDETETVPRGTPCTFAEDGNAVVFSCGDESVSVTGCEIGSFRCTGDDLEQCRVEGFELVETCDPDECNPFGLCGGQLRIAGEQEHTGRLEIYYDGEWGTVCDDDFDDSDHAADVACRELGFDGGVLRDSDDVEDGTGRIVLDDVVCAGWERSILECQHDPLGSHNCDHGEDVGVRCYEGAGGAGGGSGAIDEGER